MIKTILITICISLSLSSFSQEEKIKYRKLDYDYFVQKSINDTSAIIIDIFFDKKNNAAIGQMTLLPVAMATYVVSPPISVGLSAISLPFFINGGILMIKYRKKKLFMVLNDYKETGYLPKSIRKKATKYLQIQQLIKEEEAEEAKYLEEEEAAGN